MEEEQLLRQAGDLRFWQQHFWSLRVQHELTCWVLVGVEMPNQPLVLEVRVSQRAQTRL
jgi:hypothetical protein